MIGVPIKKKSHRDRQETRGMPYNDRGRHWNDAAASQRTPRIAATTGVREQGNGKEGVKFYPEFQKERGPADPLISDF